MRDAPDTKKPFDVCVDSTTTWPRSFVVAGGHSSCLCNKTVSSDFFWPLCDRHKLLSSKGTVSIVLNVQGSSLKEASLYLENQKLKSIPLVKDSNPWPDKISSDSAFIVLDTTRLNAGWRDIDLATERESLKTGGLEDGAGIFYLLISDGFGRTTRFDLEYDYDTTLQTIMRVRAIAA